MRGLVPKFIMLICLLHINYRPFDPCERVLTSNYTLKSQRLPPFHPVTASCIVERVVALDIDKDGGMFYGGLCKKSVSYNT